MSAAENSLSITVVGSPDFGIEVLRSLYRLTGRSTVELRNAIRAGAPIYRADLFGNDHIEVVPRLEKTADYLDGLGVPFLIHEWVDGDRDEIPVQVMREIIQAADEEYL